MFVRYGWTVKISGYGVSCNRKQTLLESVWTTRLFGTDSAVSVFFFVCVSLFNKPKCCLKTFSIFHPERLRSEQKQSGHEVVLGHFQMKCSFSFAMLLLFQVNCFFVFFLLKHTLWAHTAGMLFPDPCLRRYLTRTLNVGQTHRGRGQRKGNRKCSSIFLWPYRLPPIGRAQVMSQGKTPKLKGWKWL